METNNLPTDELKKYGIVEPDNSFSKKTISGGYPKISARLHYCSR